MGTMAISATGKGALVGAIRWDAWSGGTITEQVEKTLSPKKYQDRLPWFAEVKDSHTARIDGSPRTVMSREITFAADAGLDYWAFLVYRESDSMSIALKQYLEDPDRKKINFCLILHNTLSTPDPQWPEERDRIISLLKEPGYQTVLDGRPLIYAFTGRDFPIDRFTELRSAIQQQGITPYYVFMGWNPAQDYNNMSDKGFDAVSAYAKDGNPPEFSALVESVEETYWRQAAQAGIPYIPLVTTGWDKQPRKDHPVSWEKGHAYHRQEVFPSTATPDAIASHLKQCLSFVDKHPEVCVARAVIIYAWNEYDEGGWLAPTWQPDGTPDTSRLDAIQALLSRNDSAGLE